MMYLTKMVYSVNANFNEAQIVISVWLRLSYSDKQNITMFFSKYFEAMGSSARVTLRSNRNDTVLATYGSWGGLKIKYSD